MEVRSGKPLEVYARDKAGKDWIIQISVQVFDAIPTGNTNPDGTAEFKLNMNIALVTRPALVS